MFFTAGLFSHSRRWYTREMGSLSLTHILIIVIIALVFFGPSRLPQLGQGLGRAIRGFKDEMKGDHDDDPQAPPRSVGSNAPDQLNQGSSSQNTSTSQKQKDPNRQG